MIILSPYLYRESSVKDRYVPGTICEPGSFSFSGYATLMVDQWEI